jgi:hypothetical protein
MSSTEQQPADGRSKQVIRRVQLINADNTSQSGCANLVSGSDAFKTGVRTAQLALESAGIKGIPAKHFKDVVSLHDTPGKSSIFPYENVTKVDVLQDQDVTYNERGFGTAKVVDSFGVSS